MTDKQYRETLITRYEQTGKADFIIVDNSYSLTRKDIKQLKKEFKKKLEQI